MMENYAQEWPSAQHAWQARLIAGEAHLAAGSPADSIRILRSFYGVQSGVPDSILAEGLYWLAVACYEDGRFMPAILALEKVGATKSGSWRRCASDLRSCTLLASWWSGEPAAAGEDCSTNFAGFATTRWGAAAAVVKGTFKEALVSSKCDGPEVEASQRFLSGKPPYVKPASRDLKLTVRAGIAEESWTGVTYTPSQERVKLVLDGRAVTMVFVAGLLQAVYEQMTNTSPASTFQALCAAHGRPAVTAVEYPFASAEKWLVCEWGNDVGGKRLLLLGPKASCDAVLRAMTAGADPADDNSFAARAKAAIAKEGVGLRAMEVVHFSRRMNRVAGLIQRRWRREQTD